MDEPYRIEVLHIVNPHVIFVERQSSDRDPEPVIEQVGIYGILPVSKTIDIDGQVVAERCENWTIAANTVLREFLTSFKDSELYFLPIDVQERNTIFDEKIYLFGDILVKTSNKLSVSNYLIEQAVAEKNLSVFYQKLASGSLKIVLNTIRTNEVLNEIHKFYQKQKKVKYDWKKTINKQMSLHQQSLKLSSELTEENLRRFQGDLNRTYGVMEVLKRKEKDLSRCKETDVDSVGCGCKRKPSSHRSTIKSQTKELLNEKDEFKPANILNNLKQVLVAHGTPKYSSSDIKHNSNLDHSTLKKQNQECEEKVKVNIKNNKVNNHLVPENISREINQHDDIWDEHNEESEQSIPPATSCWDDENKSQNSIKNNKRNYKSENNCRPTLDPPKKASQHHGARKYSTEHLNPNERRIIMCPDMELCYENIKDLVPVKIVEDFTNSKLSQEISEDAGLKLVNESGFNENLKNNTNNNNDIDYYSKSQTPNKKIHAQTNNHESQNCIKYDKPITLSTRLGSSIMQRKIQTAKESYKRIADDSISSNSDTSVKDTSSSAEQSKIDYHQSKVQLEQAKVKLEQPNKINQPMIGILAHSIQKVERNVNPFKNLDGSKSVFVEKLVSPILMVHTKHDNLILPQCELRDIPFKPDIHIMLKTMRVQKPKRLQSVSWSYILRGHSVFMIGPAGNGKTLGYVPAVCNLVMDSIKLIEGVGPICVIVCATALSVSEVEYYCKRFLDVEQRIVACFVGMDLTEITTALLNGCHVLICTAPMLVTLLEIDFGVDFRRLMTLVFDDCERLAQVYSAEISKIRHHVKIMLKNRSDKSLKVQYVIASRQWCDFMTPLANKAPDTIIAIGASQECVLYSKTKTSVTFVQNQDTKVNAVVEFLKKVDCSKRTVIVCREDDEVVSLEKTLTKMKHTVFACNSTMTLHDLYKLNEALSNYQEPLLGPILICCDGNLTHLNITNAHYLIHFSMPALFSMFCKRFSVLNENYASIFGPQNEDVKIQILLDETNVEQLPKILHFVKRCTKEVTPILDNVLKEVLRDKDWKKAENLKPLCNNLLMLGECIDEWNCPDRHTIFKEFDEPKDWMPRHGVITFKISHYDSAVTYSARVVSNTNTSETTKYPNNFNTLSLKMGMYYSKEVNRRMHGVPKAGDVCAVAVKQNFFERCKVMRIIPGEKGTDHVLINLIDEEQLTVTKDINLYYLPDELKAIETHVVKIRLANIQPKDKDVTFSITAKEHLQKMADRDRDNVLYMRGQVVMTLGNCIYVDTAEACVDLSSLGETVVKLDFRKELLSRHAEPNLRHIEKLKMLAGITDPIDEENIDPVSPKVQKSPKWAHLDKDDFTAVYLAEALDPSTVILRLVKFEQIIRLLINDIKDYVEKTPELVHGDIYVGNIVLAEFPVDKAYERARIDNVVDNKTVKCFFLDIGEWSIVSVKKLRPITDNFLHRIPFQAIECRLLGVKPPGEEWPEFTTQWLYDNCIDNNTGDGKCLFAKYHTKEKATITGGVKYGVVLLDTTTDEDVVINKKMIELNLAKEYEDEAKYINEPLNLERLKDTTSPSDDSDNDFENETSNRQVTPITQDLVPSAKENWEDDEPMNNSQHSFLFKKPIRSIPLVDDSDSDLFDKFDVNIDKDMLGMFKQPSKSNITEYKSDNDGDGKTMSPEKPRANKNDGSEKVKNAVASLYNNKEEGSSSSASKIDNSKKIPETMFKSLTSQSDSDDTDIGEKRTEALRVLRNKLSKKGSANIIEQNKINKTHLGTENKNVSKLDEDVREPIADDTLDSDDLSFLAPVSVKPEVTTPKYIEVIDQPRKPKLVWRQTKTNVTIKINLIGVNSYELQIEENYIKFRSIHNDTNYEFDFELYGIVTPEKSLHSNKGQYIQVNLTKLLRRNWLNLTKDLKIKKWVVYDVDAIDFSSDDSQDGTDEVLKVIKHNHEKLDSASEDEDFDDDINFKYKKNY